jgi:DNA-binding transcriptional LysR family regulator
MIGWDDVRFMLAIQRFGSLSAAARSLSVNQTTVGRRLALLEESLQTRVFTHDGRRYQLTRAGERMLPHVERMEAEALALERDCLGQDRALSGSVLLTGPDAFSVVVLVPLLKAFRRRFPEIDLELSSEERTLDLRRREADLALRVSRPREGSLVARKVAPFALGLYASKAYLEQRGSPKSSELSKHDFVVVNREQATSTRWLQRRAGDARVVLRTNSTLAQVAAVVAGLGLGLVPCYLAARQASLVRLLPRDATSMSSLWLVTHRDLQRAARVRALSDHLFRGLRPLHAALAGGAILED